MAMLNINNHGVGGRVMPDEMSKVIHDFIRPDFINLIAKMKKVWMMMQLKRIVKVIREMNAGYEAEGWGYAILYELREHSWG